MTIILSIFSAGLLILAIGLAPFWVGYAVVWAMRSLHILAFPDAIRFAISLERDTSEWRFTKHQAEHQQIGDVWIASGASGVHVEVRLSNDKIRWDPNFVEQRIIYDAAMEARARVIHQQLDKVLPA